MIFVSGASERTDAGNFARAGLFGLLILLGGCGTRQQALAPAGAPVAPLAAHDPLGLFVAAAAPGQEGLVTMADGSRATVRVVRSYAAASGRECREVLINGGRSSLLCQTDGQWVAARPLLQGGAARP